MKSIKPDRQHVDWLYNQIRELKKGKIPKYQRKDEKWTLEKNGLLIDSIIRGYDIPKFYFRVTKRGKTGYDEFEILDGQQRLKAIFSYKLNTFSLSSQAKNIDGINVSGCLLWQLEEVFQNKFKNAKLDVYWLYDYTDIEAADFYLRLQGGVPLVPAEKRHAMVTSNMRNIVAKIVSETKVFSVCKFGNKALEYEDAIAKALHLHLSNGPVSLQNKEMERAYIKFKNIDIYDPSVKELERSLRFIKSAFTNKSGKIERNSLITLSYLYTFLSERYNLKKSDAGEFAKCFIKINDKRIYNRKCDVKEQDTQLLKYDMDMRQNSKKCLEGRYEFLEKHFIKVMNLIPKDTKRFLSDEEKGFVKRRDKGICQECGADCEKVPDACDHIIPHNDGGITSINNSQLLCQDCNSKKGGN